MIVVVDEARTIGSSFGELGLDRVTGVGRRSRPASGDAGTTFRPELLTPER